MDKRAREHSAIAVKNIFGPNPSFSGKWAEIHDWQGIVLRKEKEGGRFYICGISRSLSQTQYIILSTMAYAYKQMATENQNLLEMLKFVKKLNLSTTKINFTIFFLIPSINWPQRSVDCYPLPNNVGTIFFLIRFYNECIIRKYIYVSGCYRSTWTDFIAHYL